MRGRLLENEDAGPACFVYSCSQTEINKWVAPSSYHLEVLLSRYVHAQTQFGGCRPWLNVCRFCRGKDRYIVTQGACSRSEFVEQLAEESIKKEGVEQE